MTRKTKGTGDKTGKDDTTPLPDTDRAPETGEPEYSPWGGKPAGKDGDRAVEAESAMPETEGSDRESPDREPSDREPSDREQSVTDGAEARSDDASAASGEHSLPEQDAPKPRATDSVQMEEAATGMENGSPDNATTDTAAADAPSAANAADDAPAEPDTAQPGTAEPDTAEPDTPKPDAAPTPPAAQRGRVFPLLLGGVLAGGIGYGAHYVLPDPGPTPAQLQQMQQVQLMAREIDTLRQQFAGMDGPQEFDPAPLESRINALQQGMVALAQRMESLGGVDVEDLTRAMEDLTALAGGADARSQQAAEQVSDVVAGFAALRDSMGTLQAEMADLRDLAETRVAAAEAAIDTALARSGLDSLRAALELGESYTDAAARIRAGGHELPDSLRAHESSGIPTLETLQQEFPAAARAALRVSLTETPAASPLDRIGNFLRAQTGARSIAPRDGDDPDAVLSRVGAAMEAGQVDAALEEVQMLPQAAQDAMSGWIAAASARAAVPAALSGLTQAITGE